MMRRTVLLLTSLIAPAAAASPSLPKVSCVMTNHPYVISHYAQKELHPEEIEDWWIGGYNAEDKTGCTIEVEGKVVYKAPLVTAHPASLTDATVAVDEFRKVRAGQILKEMKK